MSIKNPLCLPPFWFVLAVAGQFVLAWRESGAPPIPLLNQLAGWSLILLGVAGVLLAFIRFIRGKTPIRPFSEPQNLLIKGVFRITRNPIYASEMLMLTGLAILLASWSALLPVVIFGVIMHFGFVLPEERLLEQKFGHDFLRYKRQTPRWLGWVRRTIGHGAVE